MLYFCKPIVQRNNHKLENSCEHRQLQERNTMPCRFANAESFGFLDLFTRANGQKKTWIPLFAMQKARPASCCAFLHMQMDGKTTDVLFCNAKSQSNGFVDLFAIKTGRGEDRSIG